MWRRVSAAGALALALTGLSAARASAANGAWTVVQSADTSSSATNILQDITCAATGDCWAVGYYADSSGYDQTLIEHYDGSAWSLVPSPDTSSSLNDSLMSVRCVNPSDCWAVGYSDTTGQVNLPLIEQYTGASWAIVAAPDPEGVSGGVLTGVACVDAGDCWAVGYVRVVGTSGFVYQTLIEQYNGSVWEPVVSANQGVLESNQLQGITCVNADECWAVGAYATTAYFTLIEEYDGSSWNLVPSPNAPAPDWSLLKSVSCAGSSSCWAVDYFEDPDTNAAAPFTAWYTVGGWSEVGATSAPTGTAGGLLGVTCNSVMDCWSVGYSHDESGAVYTTLIEHYNDPAWSTVSSPNVGTVSVLQAVTCVDSSDCFAAGYSQDGGAYQTLIEQYAESATPAVPDLPLPSAALLGLSIMTLRLRRLRPRRGPDATP